MKGRWPAVLSVGGVLLIAALGFMSSLISSVPADAKKPRAGSASPLQPVRGLAGPSAPGAARIPVPANGRAYFGVQLAWDVDTPSAYVARLGRRPAVYGTYLGFPFNDTERHQLAVQARQASRQGGMLMLTLEPMGGLETVTATASRDLALDLAAINRTGTPVMVRFGQEMNGSWYPWGQQPLEYRAAFRTVAAAVHRIAPRSAMMWAPNYGGGYPFKNGAYPPKRGTEAFAQLDTNRDGRLGIDDDPYAPYYPGDDAVDWVGLTLYHWGNTWPWGQNDIAEPGRVLRAIQGRYVGLLGDERHIPNFYHAYAVVHHKPMAIAETAAFYNLGRKATRHEISAVRIKSAWWSQVFSQHLHAVLPRLRMILWFEHIKREGGVSANHAGPIDWRVTSDPTTVARFASSLPSWLAFAP
jgi:hypothetical protein